MIWIPAILALLLVSLLAAYFATDDKLRKTTIYECLLVVIINVVVFWVAPIFVLIIVWVVRSMMPAN